MEENKLIADFMGVQYKSDEDYFKELAEMREDGIFYEQGYMESQLNYHESWDWLMPVVQKIEDYLSDNIGVVGYFDECLSSNDLDTRYQAVVEFIKQHNKQYPFQEGDDYWTIEKGRVVWSCWDDISEQIHDENPNKVYYKSQREAVKQLNKKK